MPTACICHFPQIFSPPTARFEGFLFCIKMEISRDFKGIWIPANIWLNEDLTAVEKILLAEIDSLDNDPVKGCFASNEYLGKFIGIRPESAANMISKLKKKGFVSQVYFDGRNRGLRVNLTMNAAIIQKNDSFKNESRVNLTINADLIEKLSQDSFKNEHRYKDYNKVENKEIEVTPQNEIPQNFEFEPQEVEIIETVNDTEIIAPKRKKKIERKEVGPESYENRKLSESEQILLNDLQFREAWQELLATKKWKNKSQSAINMSLKRLSEFCPEFSTILCQNAIAGQYQGVVFPDTPNHYAKWQQAKGQTMTAGEKLLERQKRMIMQGFMGGQGNDVL